MATCRCRVHRGRHALQGVDDYDEEDIIYQARRVFVGCSQHEHCPTGNTFLFLVRNSPVGELSDGPGPRFQVVCKEVVQYCVDRRVLHTVSSGTLGTADDLAKSVVAVGEYTNNWMAAHNSILRLLSNLLPMSHHRWHQRTTITSIDLPAHFKEICSGCSLPRDKSIDPSTQRFRHSRSMAFPTEPRFGFTGSYDCKYCLSRFQVRPSLDRHLDSAHRDCVYVCLDDRPFRCPDCEHKYGRERGIEDHWKTRHQSRRIGAEKDCNICHERYANQLDLACHRSTFAHQRAVIMAQDLRRPGT